MADVARDFLRHTVATLGYRAAKVLRTAPPEIAHVKLSDGSRSAVEILAHIADLLEWALWLLGGGPEARDSAYENWHGERERYLAAIKRLDDFLASANAFAVQPEQVFQGPIADALTHVGQLAMLSRAAGAPVRGENYFQAKIRLGEVGLIQAAPERGF